MLICVPILTFPRRLKIWDTKYMNMLELIQTLKDSTELSNSEAETVINSFLGNGCCYGQGIRIEMKAFCSFID